MAEENLKKTTKKMGVDIKIETNGSEGVKHELTADEIKRAKGVIIAADKKVKIARFDGKHLVNKPVTAGIKEPEALIQEILDEKAPICHATGDDGETTEEASNGGVWANIYKQLMNGISHMLPFVIGGGILMALSFVVENYMGGSSSLAFKFLNNAGNMAFAFMVPVLAGYIAEAIGDQPALMLGFVVGFMAMVYKGSFGGVYQANVHANAGACAGFLGGIAAEFIAGYIMVGFAKKLFAKLPKSVEGMKPMLLYQILGLLLIALIMFFIINPIFSGINLVITHFLNNMEPETLYF
ncbi:MAG: PTS transporter subunit EIIC [Acinetobacter sp.]|nr:PTS transporter subunit EIIC [Acinetobacter sp.]